MPIFRTIQVLLKLLPSILALRRDRKTWINQEKNEIDSNVKFMSETLDVFSIY